MNAVFIISEFNPLHFGHEYIINEAKKYGDVPVCVMSGQTVQRGEIAITDKFTRAESAIKAGADVVLELPFPYSSASADDFSFAGVSVASRLSVNGTGKIVFGAEEEKEKLVKAAEILSNREKIHEIIKKNKNLSFPKAAEILLSENNVSPDFIKKPNNILSVGYINAVKFYANLAICPVRRQNKYLSSSEIREKIKNGESIRDILPQSSQNITEIFDSSRLNPLFLYLLRNFPESKASTIYGCNSGADIVYAVKNAAKSADTVDDIVSEVKSNVFTAARVKRTILHMVSGYDKTFTGSKNIPSYTYLLAANAKGISFLNEIKKITEIPIITKPADYKKYGEKVEKDFEFAVHAEEIFGFSSKNYKNPLTRTPIIIK